MEDKERQNTESRDWQRKCATLEGELAYTARQLAGQLQNCETLEKQVSLLKRHNDALSTKLRDQEDLKRERDLLREQAEEALQ